MCWKPSIKPPREPHLVALLNREIDLNFASNRANRSAGASRTDSGTWSSIYPMWRSTVEEVNPGNPTGRAVVISGSGQNDTCAAVTATPPAAAGVRQETSTWSGRRKEKHFDRTLRRCWTKCRAYAPSRRGVKTSERYALRQAMLASSQSQFQIFRPKRSSTTPRTEGRSAGLNRFIAGQGDYKSGEPVTGAAAGSVGFISRD